MMVVPPIRAPCSNGKAKYRLYSKYIERDYESYVSFRQNLVAKHPAAHPLGKAFCRLLFIRTSDMTHGEELKMFDIPPSPPVKNIFQSNMNIPERFKMFIRNTAKHFIFLKMCGTNLRRVKIELNGKIIEQVSEFNYLGH
ncbi:hypothetical protein C0J52_26997 [Blattella germanica]|nr:hypothetical protein C0J52_26997 [Blattella germanica]